MASVAESNITTLILVGLVLFAFFLFVFFASDMPPTTVIGKTGDYLTHPYALTAFGIVFAVIAVLGIYQLWVSKKIRDQARMKYQESAEMIIRPVRLYEIDAEILSPITNYAEIQNSLKTISRKGDEGVIESVDYIISSAIRSRASDIHIEPGFENAVVKYRIDGVLQDIGELPKLQIGRILSRLRVLSNLTIYQKGKPQDGRIEIRIRQRNFDIRLSIMPTLHGEKAVIRLFESGEHQFELTRLGLAAPEFETMSDLLSRSQGTILLTGPTGSGKTTTIYSAIRFIMQSRGETTNIVTIEDPIEYEIRGVNQTQVNPKRDLTFANGLRSMLRQDPDVIVVGEIRDAETAEICSQAGLTGHLVISTIHADSSVGVFNRLIDMGIEPFLIASSLTGILAQRLVRKNCSLCAEPIIPSLKSLKILNISPNADIKFMKGKGCEQCQGRGYAGRIGIFELLCIDNEMRDAIQKKVSTGELTEIARRKGLKSLRDDALEKLKAGLVDIDDIARILS